MLELNLRNCHEFLLDCTTKGMPATDERVRLADIGRMKWNLLREDLTLPAAVLRQDSITRNRQWMRSFLDSQKISIAPHGKTTMSPQLFDLQVQDGCWGLTAATANQVAIFRKFGVQRILLANQLVGRKNIELVLSELAKDMDCEIYVLIDSVEGLDALVSAAIAHKVQGRLNLLVEMGAVGGRTGVRSVDQGLALARRANQASSVVNFCGIETYESVFPELNSDQRDNAVQAIIEDTVTLAEACLQEKLFSPGPILLTAGGTQFFDIAVRNMNASPDSGRFLRLIRSGCYLTHDDLAYARWFQEMKARSQDIMCASPDPEAALEVWAYVQSVPEPDLAILTAGKRDISFDFELPVAKWHFRPGKDRIPTPIGGGAEIFRLNDQHTFARLSADQNWTVGDMIGLGVAHVCTTFDKWDVIPVIDNDYNVVSAIKTYF
mgnify:FL=1